jgi:hypothetical protein
LRLLSITGLTADTHPLTHCTDCWREASARDSGGFEEAADIKDKSCFLAFAFASTSSTSSISSSSSSTSICFPSSSACSFSPSTHSSSFSACSSACTANLLALLMPEILLAFDRKAVPQKPENSA